MTVENYRFGHVEIDGQAYTSDVIVHGDSVQSWWREQGHRVAPKDLETLLASKPKVLVLGTGVYGLVRVPKETRRFVKQRGVELIVVRSAKAVERFNELRAAGTDVAIAMHLAC